MPKMASFDEDLNCAIRQACSVLLVDSCKEKQQLCLEHLLSNTDILARLPAGYGKSFIYQAWPIICCVLARISEDTRCEKVMVRVMFPLAAIMEDQVKTLQSVGVAAVFVRVSVPTRDCFVRALLLHPGPKMTVIVLKKHKQARAFFTTFQNDNRLSQTFGGEVWLSETRSM